MSNKKLERLKLLIGERKTVARSILMKEIGNEKELDRLLIQLSASENLFTQRHEAELYYRNQPEPETLLTPRLVEKRVWYYAKSDVPDTAFFWVQMPPEDWEKIVIAPLSDLQWGSGSCDVERFRKFVQYIKKTPNVFTFINGDLLDNALQSSIAGAVHDNIMRPHKQVSTIIEELRPIAHKILFALPGNHELRSKKVADLDPLEYVCQALGIPYSLMPVHFNILWHSWRFNFYCHHGVSGSATPGGRMNAAMKPVKWNNFSMFFVMGHVHDPISNPILRRCVLRDYDEKGRLKRLRVVDREQYVVICPAWVKYRGSYAQLAEYEPSPIGYIFCNLYPNGKYDISQ